MFLWPTAKWKLFARNYLPPLLFVSGKNLSKGGSDRSLPENRDHLLEDRYKRLEAKAGRGGGIRTPTRGFGDRWSAVKPTPLLFPAITLNDTLLNLPMHLVLPAERAEFFQLEAFCRRLLVLRVRVVFPLTLGALKRNNISRHKNPFVPPTPGSP